MRCVTSIDRLTSDLEHMNTVRERLITRLTPADLSTVLMYGFYRRTRPIRAWGIRPVDLHFVHGQQHKTLQKLLWRYTDILNLQLCGEMAPPVGAAARDLQHGDTGPT